MISVPIVYVNESLSEKLANPIKTHKRIEEAYEDNRAQGVARDPVKSGTWKKIERKSATSMQLELLSERKVGSKKREHND